LIIRTDGSEETRDIDRDTDLASLINAEYLDTVNLRDGRVMMVDDRGYDSTAVRKPDGGGFELVPVRARKPLNKKATALYHSVCIRGTTHQIVGDVVIVRDEDIDEDEDDE
jgi:hypothetical protein